MHKKDYLQRQFEEFGKALSLILGLKRDRDWEKFEKEINEASLKFTSHELTAIERFSDAEFEAQVMDSANMSQDQKKILATLLFEKMNLYLDAGATEKYTALKSRCLSLYRHLKENLTSNEFDLDVHYKIDALSRL